jgi:2-polyprenyl-6-methoxyphenol hydroxylase-like FAD-dependent oxidoreductase
MTQPTVVISGAGIAGPALAHWLSATGYRVVVVEIAPGIRPGGRRSTCAVQDGASSSGWDCWIRWSSDRWRRGVAWAKSDGRRRAEMPVEAFHGNGLVSKLEILRGDLVDVL